ncbi:hybrid sensor histidine kinase/response regulator [Nevskia soli]|jgi:PAS domain S-box-containing protein|uniref:hybrid sensor histidine kinase/response regulator n=1 Tax=Nevskia soli TaxID=418856 RepID=UPI0015D88459|nr:PAS domain-containing protein [Nevskia soli]
MAESDNEAVEREAVPGAEAEDPRDTLVRVLESISDGFFTLDTDWCLRYMNAAAEQLLGGRRQDLLGRKNWEIYPDLLGTIAEHEFRRAASERVPVEFEIFYTPWSRWFAVKAYPVQPGGISVYFRDITASKEADLLLREKQQRLQAMYEGTYEYIGLLTPDGTLIEANRSSLEFTGATREEVLGLPFWDTPWFTATPGASAAVREAVARAAAGEFVRFELTVRRPSGEAWDFDVSFHPVVNADGKVELIVPEGRNITEQNKDKERLRQQWRMFDTVLSNVADLLYIFDREGRFMYVNRAVVERSQRPLERTIGRTVLEVGYPPELGARLRRQIQHVLDTGQPVRDQTPWRAPDGEIRYFEYIYSPVKDADGRVEAVAGTTRDVTEQKLAEERELKRQAQLRDSARLESLGVLAGGIAHDFNNLLTGIMGNASLLAETGSENNDPGRVVLAREILSAAERAGELTRQMLAYSGKGSFMIESIDLNRLIRDNMAPLRASLSRNVTVALELDDNPCFIEADRNQIHQVVTNLVINAAEAAGELPGKVTIRSAIIERKHFQYSEYLHTSAPPGNYALLEVQDAGCGMSAETLKKIFDPFFTTKFTGRGLGLAAVLGIVRGHGGDIDVQSELGAGTTFRVFLPASKAAVQPGRSGKGDTDEHAENQTILVVDDELMVRRVGKAALERAGFRVVTAADGAEALEVLRGEPNIAAIILDLTMPVMTGEEALPLIRERHPRIPVLLSSGFNEAEISRRFSGSGISGVLPKPYTAATIVSMVRTSIRSKAS